MSTTPRTLEEHAAFVRALARSLVLDSHAADDVVQDTWLVALERPPRHDANPRAWLGRIVERFAARRRRSAERLERRESAAARPERVEGGEEALARAELLRRVTDAVLALAEPYRTAVLLRFYEGLDAHAIARRTDAPLATVRSRLQRALAQLRGELDRAHGGDRRQWCEGLVALLAGNEAVEIGAGGASGSSAVIGAGGGVMAMGVMTKTAAGVTIAALAGVFAWRATSVRDPQPTIAATDGKYELQLAALDEPVPSPGDLARAEPASERLPVSTDAGLAAEHGALEGRVTWERDGRPAAGEELSFLVWSHPVGKRALHAFADEEGRFRLEGLLPGAVHVETNHGASAAFEIVAGETTRAELEIALGFTVRGQVLDQAGAPVRGARLWLSAYGNYEGGAVVGATRADGRFELVDVPEGRYLGAIADGFAPSHVHFLSSYQAEGEALSDVELTLTLNGEGGGLLVRLRAPGGASVAGGLVRLAGKEPPERKLGGNRRLRNIPTFEARSDASGRVLFDGLPPGPAKVTVLAAGLGVWNGSAPIEPGETAELVVPLAKEGVVTGTVRTTDGEPAQGASVYLDEEYDALRPSTKSDERGHYELRGLPSGDLSLKAWRDELGRAQSFVRVEAGASASWDPVLAAGRVITGRAVDEEGAVLSGWTVEAQIGIRSPWRAQVTTDAEGGFRLLDLKPGLLLVELWRDNVTERLPTLRRLVAEGEDELLLRVTRADLCEAALTVRFLDPEGRPIPKASVAVWPSGESSAPGFGSDSQGVVRAEHLRAGTYELSATFQEHPTLFLGPVALAPAERRDLGTIVLAAPGAVRITVRGRPPAEDDELNWFTFRQLDDGGRSGYVASVKPGEAAEPVRLNPGRYVLYARAQRDTAAERVAFELRSGETRTIDLLPRAGRTVIAHLEVASGATFPEWARLRVRDAGGELVDEWVSTTAFEPRYPTALQLAPGAYELAAEASDGRRAGTTFEVALGDEPFELRVTLR